MGVDEEDSFSEETLFSTEEEFKEKLTKLLTDKNLYQTCLAKQNELVKKYFNKEWMRAYIIKHTCLEI